MKTQFYKYGVVLLLIFSIVFPFYFLRFGVDFTDTFFHYNNISNYKDTGELGSSMTFLSTFLLSSFSDVFPHDIISYRYFNYFICLLNLILPLIYFRRNLDFQKYLVLFSLVVVAYISLLRSMIGYDSISDFFLINVFLSISYYVFSESRKFLLLTGFFIACATASRLPDIVSILGCGFIILILLFKKIISLKKATSDIVLLLSSFLIFYCVIILLIIGSLEEYAISLTASNLNYTYNAYNLINKYLVSLFYIGQLLLFFYFLFLINKFNFNNRYLNTLKKWLSYFFLVAFFFYKVSKSSYFTMLSWCFTAFLLLVIVNVICDKMISEKNKMIALLILFFSFIPAVGSNTGLLKVNMMYYAPLLITFYTFRYKSHIISFCWFLFAFGLYERFNNTYDDKPYRELNSSFNSPILRNIKSCSTRAKLVDEVERKSKEIVSTGNEVVFYGMNSHVFNSVTGIKTDLIRSFDRSFYNNVEISLFDEYLSKKENVFFIITNQYVWGKGEDFEKSPFLKLMNKYSYSRQIYEGYEIFVPKTVKS